jgi:hypothetical protein
MSPKLGLSLSLALLLATPMLAQAPIPPRPSPNAKVEQSVGVSKISISYSRPGVKGRQIYGGLVPWGEVWRTGANEATIFETSHDATIGGKTLPAGKYAFFSIPNQDKWTLIWNRQAEQWGSGNYKPEEDVLKVEVKPQAIPAQERFEIRFLDADDNTAKVELRWADVLVPFEVTFDTKKLAIEEGRKAAAKVTNKDEARALTGWATYAYQNNLAPAEAEAWVAKAAEENDSYRIHALHARLLAKNGKIPAAKAAAEKAFARAAGADKDGFGVADDSAKLKQELASWK